MSLLLRALGFREVLQPAMSLDQQQRNAHEQACFAILTGWFGNGLSNAADRELERLLRLSATRNEWRKAAGLPKPTANDIALWQTWLRRHFLLIAFRKRHPQKPALFVVRSRQEMQRRRPNTLPAA